MAASSADDGVCKKDCVINYIGTHNSSETPHICPPPPPPPNPLPDGWRQKITNCINPTQGERSMYDLFGGGIRWRTGVTVILERFITHGLLDRFGYFKQKLDNLLGNGHFPNTTGRIVTDVQVTSESYKLCNNITSVYRIEHKKGASGLYTDRDLFHISIHSENPIYVMGTTRSKYSCAKYPNHGGAQNVGAFHYKIDLNDENEELANYKPYKKFDTFDNGRFRSIYSQRFLIDPLDYAIFHGYIYNRFIRYWNRCISHILSNYNKNELAAAAGFVLVNKKIRRSLIDSAIQAANNAVLSAHTDALADHELDNIKEDWIDATVFQTINLATLAQQNPAARNALISQAKGQIRQQINHEINGIVAAAAASAAAEPAAEAAAELASVAMGSSFSEAASAAASSRQEIALTRAEAKAAARIELARRGELQREEIARLPLEERAATLAAIVKEKIPITREALARAAAAAEAAAPFIAENEAAEAKFDSLDTESKRLQHEHTDIKKEDQGKKQTEQMRRNAGMRESAIKAAKTDALRAKEELRIKKEINRKPIESATEEAADAQAIKDDTNKYISAARTAAVALIAFRNASKTTASAVSGVIIRERNQANNSRRVIPGANNNEIGAIARASVARASVARAKEQVNNNEIKKRAKTRREESRSPFPGSKGGRTKKNKKRGRRTKKNKKRNTRKR
jgi:hypothetical protein